MTGIERAPPVDFEPLQHIRGSKVNFTQACQPATFRPQGLVTLSTGYSLRTRAGSVSHQRHSWGSSALRSVALLQGHPEHLRAEWDPPAVSHDADTPADSRDAARRAAVPGLCPLQESLVSHVRYEHTGDWMLPWAFVPSRVCQSRRRRSFPCDFLSHALTWRTTTPPVLSISECRTV